MAVSVAIESPLQDEVKGLVEALDAHLLPLAPAQFHFGLNIEEMTGSDTTVFVARNDASQAIGLGALKDVGPDAGLRTGEVKRMFTAPAVRGQRVGSALLAAICDCARALGIERLVLETGVGEGLAAAIRLYQNHGFTECGAVLDYPDSGYSRFFEKKLSA
ncbi:GNAT family N-acetyltransferase [Hoeflea ulvae]|uniref:GNAT family N-acetyltransferase n=1 Tax=Hoeflea ulvae TaxID=2983764 RepID=A0ABT3YFK1_9HYPH|nr:GNAT family N-acetyltransferase [Hoeflea ulvae]MCY0094673.1 GNAT family N-acetyltransferase [Hoeflea ulvae]